RWLEWLLGLLDRHEIHWGLGDLVTHSGDVIEITPLAHMAWIGPRCFAWATILGPEHEPLLPRKELALELPKKVRGASVHTTKRNVVILAAPGPVAIDEGRAKALSSAMAPIFRRSYTKAVGYDPYDYIADAMKRAMAKHDFERAISPKSG